MENIKLIAVTSLFAAILALDAASAAAQPVRIAGSGANVGAIELLAAEFAKSHPGARFAPIQAVGTGSSIRAATGGRWTLRSPRGR